MCVIYVDAVMVLHSSKASDSAYERFRSAFFSRWEAEDEGHMTDLLNDQGWVDAIGATAANEPEEKGCACTIS